MPRGKPIQKGQRLPGAGRPKGCKNKFTTLKEAFINAFTQIGGEEALVDWLHHSGKVILRDKKGNIISTVDLGDRKKEFFKMLASMLPKEVQLSGSSLVDTSTHFHLTHLEGENIVKEAERRGIPIPEPVKRRFAAARKNEPVD